jgi:hypothetical protein
VIAFAGWIALVRMWGGSVPTVYAMQIALAPMLAAGTLCSHVAARSIGSHRRHGRRSRNRADVIRCEQVMA